MNCRNCGACCLDESPPVLAADKSVPIQFIAIEEETKCIKKCDGACSGFNPDTRLCMIHENRPSMCSKTEAGSIVCKLARLWADFELEWFSKNARFPEDGAFNRFCSLIKFTDKGRIISISGYSIREHQIMVDAYNNSITP